MDIEKMRMESESMLKVEGKKFQYSIVMVNMTMLYGSFFLSTFNLDSILIFSISIISLVASIFIPFLSSQLLSKPERLFCVLLVRLNASATETINIIFTIIFIRYSYFEVSQETRSRSECLRRHR